MRLADLIGSMVVEAYGDEIGRVGDVWLIQDGPPMGVFGAALRFDKLVIGRFGLASRAWYERPDVKGPVILARLLGRGTKHRPVASWSDIASIEEGRIRLRLRARDLERPRSLKQPATGRRWSAGLELLDRQLVDPDGGKAGKVDDLRLELRDEGPPIVTEILAGPGALARRKVVGQRELLRRHAVLVLPRRERLPVAAGMLARPAEGEQDEAAGTAVDELAAHGRGNAGEVSTPERLLLALDQQGEGSLEHQVDLLLHRMAVDAATLAGLQHELVEAEGRHPELPAEREEALSRIEVQPCTGDAGFHGENARRTCVDRDRCGDTDVEARWCSPLSPRSWLLRWAAPSPWTSPC